MTDQQLNTKKACVLCESEKQIEFILSHPFNSNWAVQYIALTPSAAWALESRGIKYQSIEDFQIKETTTFTETLITQQIEWANKTDDFLQESIGQFKEGNFRPARHYLYHLKPAWDTFVHRYQWLDMLYDALHPDCLVFFNNPDLPKYNNLSELNGSYIPGIATVWAVGRKIQTMAFAPLPDDTFWHPHIMFNKSIQRIVYEHLPHSLKNCITESLFLLKHAPRIFSQKKSLSKEKYRLVIRPQYDITFEVADALTHHGFELQSFDKITSYQITPEMSKNLHVPLRAAWERVRKTDWFFSLGIGTAPTLRPHLELLFENFWFSVVPDLFASMNMSRRNLVTQKSDGIFTPMFSGIPDIGTVMAARELHIPIFMYQHGANMGEIENPLWDVTDRYFSDYLFVYGKGEAEYLTSRSSYTDIKNTPVPVGSARLEVISKKNHLQIRQSIRKKLFGNSVKPLIVYVPTILISNFYIYSYAQPRNISLFDLRHRMGEILHRNSDDFHFVYKSFYAIGTDPTMDMMHQAYPSCTFVSDIPLSDLQWAADVLIYEVPSTGLFEGLTTQCPILLFADENVFTIPPEVTRMLDKRVTLSRTPEKFYESLDKIPELVNQYPVMNADEEFIKKFCFGGPATHPPIAVASVIYDTLKKRA